MAHTTHGRTGQSAEARTNGREALAGGLVAFAAVMLILNGVLGVFRGVMGIAEDDVFVTTPSYVFEFDTSGWGWVHLVIGALAVLVGVSLFSGVLWARVAGVLLAGCSLMASFLSVPYYPLWSIVLMAIDVFIIWALCVTRGRPMDAM